MDAHTHSPHELSVGLLGCGAHAGRVQLPILLGLDGVRVALIAEADPRALDKALASAPAARGVADYASVDGLDTLDAVVVALPSSLHAPAARRCLAAGIPTYVEKPLALTVSEGTEVRDAAAGAMCAVGFNYRFNRLYAEARRQIASGRAGPVRRVRSSFCVAGGTLPEWKRRRVTGGGALLDLASHHIDLLMFLLDARVEAVSARIQSVESEDDVADLRMRLENGIEASGHFSLRADPQERFEIDGDDGTLIVDRTRYQDIVFLSRGARPRETPSLRVGQAIRNIPYILEKRRTPGHEPSHRIALERFLSAVSGGHPFAPDAEDGIACLRVIEAAERSAASGGVEPVVWPP